MIIDDELVRYLVNSTMMLLSYHNKNCVQEYVSEKTGGGDSLDLTVEALALLKKGQILWFPGHVSLEQVVKTESRLRNSYSMINRRDFEKAIQNHFMGKGYVEYVRPRGLLLVEEEWSFCD